jgi:hypothetical protein
MGLSLFPSVSSHMSVFILDLHPDDRASILHQKSLNLLPYLLPVPPYITQIRFVVAPQPHSLFSQFYHPVRESSVTDLPMNPWAQTKQHLQSHLAAQLQISVQIPASRKVKYSLFLLVMNPDYIGGHNSHPSGLHLSQGFFPKLLLVSCIMHFPHHRKPRPAVLL